MNLTETISQCIKRNKVAEKQLYINYAQKVFGICRRYAQDDQLAEDYMQDSFTKIFSKLNTFDSGKGNFDSWISRIVVNTIISDKRKKRVAKVYQELDDNLLEGMPEVILDNELIANIVNQKDLLLAIRKMPQNYREVLNLYVFEELSHKDIGQLLNIKETSSRSRFSRAKKILKNILVEKLAVAI